MKTCSKCRVEKELKEFNRSSKTKDNYKPYCRSCQAILTKEYYIKNKARITEKHALYREENIEKEKQRHARYQKDNRERVNSYAKKWNHENKDKIRQSQLSYLMDNPLIRTESVKLSSREATAKYRHSLAGKFAGWKGSAKRRGIEWKLTLKNLEQLPQICYYTEKPLGFDADKYNTISLDRLDSSKGYTKDNVVFCCAYINRMKQDLNLQEFIEACGIIYKKFNPK